MFERLLEKYHQWKTFFVGPTHFSTKYLSEYVGLVLEINVKTYRLTLQSKQDIPMAKWIHREIERLLT